MKILLLGAPGSGKGTLSEYLISKYNFVHISTGNIFRKVMEQDNELSQELKSYILKGLLVPDNVTNKIVENDLKKLIAENKSIVLDGYPRTIEQADFLKTILDLDKVIYLNVDQNILEKRLTGRRMCDKCKTIYNIYFSPSKVEGICDNDNEPLIQRKDDNIETIKERMETYKATTSLLIDYYKDKIIEINGTLSKEEIHKKIDDLIL